MTSMPILWHSFLVRLRYMTAYMCLRLYSTCGFEVHDFEVCCAAIWLHDVYNITVKGIHVAVSKNVSDVVWKNISWITVQLTTSCFLTNRKCLGIAIYGGTSVNVHSSSANNCSFGLVLRNTTNTHITNAIVMHSEIVGVTLHMTRNTYVTNTITMYSGWSGMCFYITSNCIHLDAQYLSRSTCFLNIEGSRSQKWLTFVNNSAGKGGDILYRGHVPLGIDRHWNCLDSFKNVSYISQNGLSLISSDLSQVCVCNGSGQHDCQIVAGTNPHPVYPSQYISIPAVVVGQDLGTVTGSVYAQFLQKSSTKNPPQFETWQTVQAVTQHNCSHLKYTIFSQTEVLEAVLVLTAHDSYVSRLLNNNIDTNARTLWTSTYKTIAVEPLMKNNNPIYINISLLPCPSGFMLTTDPPFRCDCDMLLQKINEFQCHIQEHTISRSGLLWVGMIQDDNGTNGTVAVSEYCPLDYCKKEKSNVTLSEPDTQCEHNHSGVLCGGCQPSLSLALGSERCLPCSNKYLALLIPFALAGPALVFCIKFLDLTISQGTLNGLIFYANIVQANEYVFLPQRQTNPLSVFLAWLNLNLGVETLFSRSNCLFQDMVAICVPILHLEHCRTHHHICKVQ